MTHLKALNPKKGVIKKMERKWYFMQMFISLGCRKTIKTTNKHYILALDCQMHVTKLVVLVDC